MPTEGSIDCPDMVGQTIPGKKEEETDDEQLRRINEENRNFEENNAADSYQGVASTRSVDFLQIDADDKEVQFDRQVTDDSKPISFKSTNSIRISQLDDDAQAKLKKQVGGRQTHISVDHFMASVNEADAAKSQSAFLRKTVAGLMCVMVVLLGGFFSMSYMAIQLSKDMKMSNSGAIMAMDGSPARIASSDFAVSQDGTMIALQTSGNAPKQSGNASMPLATRPAETKRSLSSTIPNKLFDEMAKLTVNGADGVSHMTLQILAFTRVLTPSKCGSLVHLSTHHGTVTLDDTTLHFDDQLSARAVALGIDMEGTSMHGRRLASGAEVAGIFSFFEDYDWQCDSIPVPKSPEKPYVIKMLKQISCPADGQCLSSMGKHTMYPGYHQASSSVMVEETIAETDDFLLSIKKYPNHPLQTLVTLTDHKLRTHRSMQIFAGAAYHCVPQSYASVVGNETDSLSSYFAAYLGHETRSSEEFHLPWGRVTIPGRTVRAFRLEPKKDVDGALPIPIDYDDDAETLLPTRLAFNGAEQVPLDVKEILVEVLQQNAQEAASALRKKVDLQCGDIGVTDLKLNVPVLHSAVTESKQDVDFYVREYLEMGTGDAKTDEQQEPKDVGMDGSYWMRAIEMQEAREENAGRRLKSKASTRKLFDLNFNLNIPPDAKFSANTNSGNGGCLTLNGETDNAASPWSFSGSLAMGKGCQTPYSQFTMAGRVQVTYGWGFSKSKTLKVALWEFKINYQCNLEINGYIAAKTGTWSYPIGHGIPLSSCVHRRRLSRRLGVNATAVGKTNVEEDLEDDLAEEASAPDLSESRDLLSRRISAPERRLKKTRRRSCTTSGFEIYAGLGINGGCSVFRRRIGVSLHGRFDMSLGPFPDPLEGRAKGKISAKGCIKIGPFDGCIDFPGLTLFDASI